MKYLSYKNYIDFKNHFKGLAKKNNIDLDFYFDSEDYICIYIKCILQNHNPVKMNLDEINNIILDMLLESDYLK